MKKNILNSVLVYTIGSFGIQGLRFITLPFFSRMMAPDDYALMSSYESWVSILLIFIGLQAYACLNNAYIDFGEENIDRFASSISWLVLFTGVPVSLLTYIFRGVLTDIFQMNDKYLQIGVIQCVFTFYLTLLITKFRIRNKPLEYVIYSILNSILNIGLSMVLVWIMPNDKYVGRIIASLIAVIMMGGVSASQIYKAGGNCFDKKYIKYTLAFTGPLIFHSLGGIILGRTDQIMLLKLSGQSAMGIYSYGSNYAHIIYVLYTAANLAYGPIYYRLKEKKEEKRVIQLNYIYMEVYLNFMGCFILILPEIIKVMSGKEYYSAINSAPLLAFSFLINFLYTFPVNYEFYRKNTKYIAYSTCAAACVNLVLNYVLIQQWNEVGAAMATCTSMLFQLIIHFSVAKKLIKKYEMNIAFFMKGLINIMFIACIYYIFKTQGIFRIAGSIIYFIMGVVVILKNREQITG